MEMIDHETSENKGMVHFSVWSETGKEDLLEEIKILAISWNLGETWNFHKQFALKKLIGEFIFQLLLVSTKMVPVV